jgi:hypothetical protein
MKYEIGDVYIDDQVSGHGKIIKVNVILPNNQKVVYHIDKLDRVRLVAPVGRAYTRFRKENGYTREEFEDIQKYIKDNLDDIKERVSDNLFGFEFKLTKPYIDSILLQAAMITYLNNKEVELNVLPYITLTSESITFEMGLSHDYMMKLLLFEIVSNLEEKNLIKDIKLI